MGQGKEKGGGAADPAPPPISFPAHGVSQVYDDGRQRMLSAALSAKCRQSGEAGLPEPLRAKRSSGFCPPSFHYFQMFTPNPLIILNIHYFLTNKTY